MIYSYVFSGNTRVVSTNRGGFPNEQARITSEIHTTLLKVSKAVYGDAELYLYDTNLFSIQSRSRTNRPSVKTLYSLYGLQSFIGAAGMQRVRHLEIQLPGFLGPRDLTPGAALGDSALESLQALSSLRTVTFTYLLTLDLLSPGEKMPKAREDALVLAKMTTIFRLRLRTDTIGNGVQDRLPAVQVNCQTTFQRADGSFSTVG
jgi:hypothetical protein